MFEIFVFCTNFSPIKSSMTVSRYMTPFSCQGLASPSMVSHLNLLLFLSAVTVEIIRFYLTLSSVFYFRFISFCGGEIGIVDLLCCLDLFQCVRPFLFLGNCVFVLDSLGSV